MIEWKDATSYRRGRSGKDEPRTFTAEVGAHDITVTRYHGIPDDWFLLSRSLGISTHQKLGTNDIEEAKAKALNAMKQRLLSRIDEDEMSIAAIELEESMNRPDPGAAVEKFNATHDIGTLVRYWTGAKGDGPGEVGETRTEAQVLGGHTAVVWVEGHPACIALTHVEAEDR